MRAAIAVRVSPRPRENVRYSPEIQEQKCREWCAANGHDVVVVVSDILVSGGAADRFDSIFAALDAHSVEVFVVADLSRWTRDRPSRFWAIKAILEDRGVRLASVDDPYVNSDAPFSDTITTARVEANYQERQTIKRKTSEGVRKAWASGKRWGHALGWTWHPREPHEHDGAPCDVWGRYTQDADTITAFYRDWVAGVSTHELSRRYGMSPAVASRTVESKRQREIVGDDLWRQAQSAHRIRRTRAAKWASIYAGLLLCPMCGRTMQQSSTNWGNYRCSYRFEYDHGWFSLSARKWVTPIVRDLLARIEVPQDERELYERSVTVSTPHGTRRNMEQEIERLTLAWTRDRISTETYDRRIAALEAERVQPAIVTPPAVQLEILGSLSVIDLEDRRRETGQAANVLLRHLLEPIRVGADRSVEVSVREEYRAWVVSAQ